MMPHIGTLGCSDDHDDDDGPDGNGWWDAVFVTFTAAAVKQDCV